MEKQPVVFGNEDGGTKSNAAPAYVLVKQPQTTGKTDQGTLVSNQDDCGLNSSAVLPIRSKAKDCLPADCTSGGTTVILDNNNMWNKFYHRSTEMILTKQGRRMFPYCRYWITGLESNLKYILIMDISPVDNFRYKWNGHSWEPNGKAEPHVLGRVFIHPESPSTGRYWMHQPVSFYKLKLTNNTLDQEGHIILHSMHRYLPRLHLVPADKATEVIQLNGPDVHTFTFPQTEFFAVTAYQNIQITQLKIDYNPFVKGFRKDELSSKLQYDLKKNGSSEQEGGTVASFHCNYSSSVEDDVLNSQQRCLNATNSGWKIYNTDLERQSFHPDAHVIDAPILNPIASSCENDSHLKSLPIANGGTSISIKIEPIDDYDYGTIVHTENTHVKQEETVKEAEEYFCRDDDSILEKQLKKQSEMGRKETELESHKRPQNSLLHVARTKKLRLDSETMPIADLEACEVNKRTVKISALQAILSSCMTKKSLNHSVNSLPAHFENNNTPNPLTAMETKTKKCFSGNGEQKCSLVKDLPWKNPETHSNIATMKQAPSSSLMHSASVNFTLGRKKPNSVKNPMLSKGVDCNASAVLSGPSRRGRPRKLKFSEVGQHLKYTRKSLMTNDCAPSGSDFAHSAFMFDLDDVDGVLFASFASKEVLDNHTVDKSGEEELHDVRALLSTCDSDCQVRLHLLEKKLLEDLKSFRHKQVIHPSLREVGLKLGSVDPTLSIDLKYLGVQLPLSPSKDYVFGNIQGSCPSSQDIGLSFISRTGKTNDFRKIKGWQGKFDNVSRQEGNNLEGSLKNLSAFCSDKLDEYLENEGKLMETSIRFSTSASSCPAVYQLPSKNASCVEALGSALKRKSIFTQPSSYTSKPLSVSTCSRKRRRKTKNKQALSKGSKAKSSSKFSVPSLVPSKQKCNLSVLNNKVIKSQPSSQVGDEGHVFVISELDEFVPRKPQSLRRTQRTSCLSLPKALGKLMDLESCALRNGKPPSYITEDRADFSLAALFVSQDQVELMDVENCALQCGKPRTYITKERADLSLGILLTVQASLKRKPVYEITQKHDLPCDNDLCQPGCVCAGLALEKCQATLPCKMNCTFDCLKKEVALIKAASKRKINLKPLNGIVACCDGQEEEWELEQKDKQKDKQKTRNESTCNEEPDQPVMHVPVPVKEEGENDAEPIYIPPPSAPKPAKDMILSHSEVVVPLTKNKPTDCGVEPEQEKTLKPSSEGRDSELLEEPFGTENNFGGCDVEFPLPGISVLPEKTTCHSDSTFVSSATKLSSQIIRAKPILPISATQTATILPPEPIPVPQAVGLFSKPFPAGTSIAQVARSDPKITFCSTQATNNATSLIPLQSSRFSSLQFPGQKSVLHIIFQHVVPLQVASNSDRASHKGGLGTTIPKEGLMSYSQEMAVSESEVTVLDTMSEENELMAHHPDCFDELTEVVACGMSEAAADAPQGHMCMGEELSDEAPLLDLDTSTNVVLSDHSYFSRKPNNEKIGVVTEKQDTRFLKNTVDASSEGCWQTEVLANNTLQGSPISQENAAQFKSSDEKQIHVAQVQSLVPDSQDFKQPQFTFVAEWPQEQQQNVNMTLTAKQQHGTKSLLRQWESEDNLELLGRLRKKRNNSMEIKRDEGEEEKREAEVNCVRDRYALGKKYLDSEQDLLSKTATDFQEKNKAASYIKGTTGIQGDNQSVKDNLGEINGTWNKISNRSFVECLEQNVLKTNHCKSGLRPIIDIALTDKGNNEGNNERNEDFVELISGVSDCQSENIVNIKALVRNADKKNEFRPIKLKKKTSHSQEVKAMELEVMRPSTKPGEKILPASEPGIHSEGITCYRNTVTSETVEKDDKTKKHLPSAAPICRLDVILSDHSYVLKMRIKKEEDIRLPEVISDSISLLDESESGEDNDTDVDIDSVEELPEKRSTSRLKTAAAPALLSRHIVNDHSNKGMATSPEHSELQNKKQKNVAQTVAAYRPKHTEDERRRRGEMKELFEKLKVVLGWRTRPRVSKRMILKQALEEIQGLMHQADKLTSQKKLLMRKQTALIRKASALAGKTRELILKKLEYMFAKRKAVETRKNRQHKEEPVKVVETVETLEGGESLPPAREVKPGIVSNRLTKPLILSRKESCATETEESFMMPRIVNVMSLATEEHTDLNLDVNTNPYVTLDADCQAFEHPLQIVSLGMTNLQSEEKGEASHGRERGTSKTTQVCLREKENNFLQIINVSNSEESPESFATKLCTEELSGSHEGKTYIDKGGDRQKAKESLFQKLQAKEPKDFGMEMELTKVATAIQEAALNANELDAGVLMDIEENYDTNETLTSLLNEITFLNQQLNDNASDILEFPNSLTSGFALGHMETHKELATADGSPVPFGALDGSFKDFCLVQESSDSVTPLLLHLEDDNLVDDNRNLRDLSLESGVLKSVPDSEVKDPNPDLSAITSGRSWKNTACLVKTTNVSPPTLQMKTNLKLDNADTVWKPMPKLAPFGLKGSNFPLDSGGRNTKVMPLLAPVGTKLSSIELKATQRISQGQDCKVMPTPAPVVTRAT